MDQDTFNKETALCRQLASENGGRCNWGECAHCGVIPLLSKLYKDEFIDNPKAVAKLRSEVLGQ